MPFFHGPRRIGVAATCVVALGVLGGTVRAATADEVSVVADGRTTQVGISGQDVRAVVDSAGVQLGPHDQVSGQLADGGTLIVARAHQFTVNVDGALSQQWSTRRTVGEALADLLGEALATSAVSQPSAMPLYPDPVSVRVTTRKHATVVEGGTSRSIQTTAVDVAGMLDEMGVVLGGQDLVLPGTSAAVTEGLTVHVSRLAPGQVVTRVPIKHGIVRRPSSDVPVGRTRVAQRGTDGVLTRIYALTMQDGTVVSRRLVQQVVAVPAVPTVILVGTRGAPTGGVVGLGSPRVPGSGTGPGSGGSGSGRYPKLGNTVWDDLATCESSNNWHINTGNGYYGGLQFDLPTWRAYGGTGYPHEHTREEQIAVAERLRAARGFAPWPVCARKLGLL